jgi:hypothetical protein
VTSGTPLRLLSLAAFVGGGLLAPVAHLAWHRPGHSHGPDGGTTALAVESGHAADHRDGDRHAHPHPHAHPHEGHDHADDHGEAHELRRAAGETPAGAESAVTEPLEVPHGHGSLAHFGLALLSAPPPLELPAPASSGAAPPEERTQPAARHHPRFPLPRPPPGLVAS